MARFLVVDDDSATVHAMTRLLTDEGHHVTPFTAGADAVDALSRDSFDAVVTDLDMPHVDGHAVVLATRDRSPTACVVVVSTTAEEDTEHLAEAGACIISDKPMDYASITKSIADCRARGGPGAHGRCHMKSSQPEPPLAQLRRK